MAKSSLKVFSVVFFALALFFSISAWRGVVDGRNTWLDLTIAMVLFLAGVAITVPTFTASVVLTADSIRHGNMFRSDSLNLNQIRYRREYEEYQNGPEGGVNVSYLEFVSYDGEAKSLKISKDDFDFDTAFWEWVLRIPDFEDLKPVQAGPPVDARL